MGAVASFVEDVVGGAVEAVGEAVALGRIVAVVLVRADRVEAEPAVGRGVDRQHVVVAEQDGLAVSRHQQLRRERAVEGPNRQRVLRRHARVELHRDAAVAAGNACSADVIQAARPELTVLEAVHLQ